jgi:phage terminase large subunit-like protein
MPWQAEVADVALEHEGGRFAYRDVAVGTPRQSGKSVLLEALVVWRLLSGPDLRVVYGAQSRLAARTMLFDVWWPRIRRSALGPMFTLSRATGAEALRCQNGSVMSLLSTEPAAGHGLSTSLCVLDECWTLDAAAEQSTRPTMSAMPNSQIWMASTAGTTTSTWWRSKVELGRSTSAVESTMAYFEWSAADDADVTDPDTWAEFMPALNLRIEPATVEADLAAMELAEWRRCYGNQWPEVTDVGWKVIPRDVWERARL